MFQVIDALGYVHNAYGTFVDEDGDVQFILCDSSGRFRRTDQISDFYRLYTEDIKAEF